MADVFERLKAALGDRYAIERELGSGGMATVYLAEDLKHDRKVAVKVLRPDLAAALGPERFLQEIKIAAQLHHPHILPLHDSGEADGFLYYVMPYEAGRSLRDKLATEGELPIGEAVRLLRDVVDALSHAHEQGVVHRDIKPENILLSGHHALVSDFGVAKAVSEATGRDKLTTAGVALGTPAYMAPEQASADPHIDQRADIYGVGALAYEVLTGRPPFLGSTPQQVLSAHVTETAEPVTRYRTTVPPVLEQLVMRCLEKRPADRWQSAQELVTQLEALTTPSGGITPTDTRPITAAVGRRRTGLYVVLGIAAAVAAVAAAAWLLRPVGEQELNPNLIAVAPFDVLDTSLEDPWREGLAQIVALGVDGAGPLRCVPPSVIFKHWSGPGDMASVSAVGRDAGAGLGVYGRLTGSGPDSVRMTATLFDVRNDVALGEFDDLYESVDRIDRLGDSLAARILTVLSRVRPLGAVRTNSLGSSSPAAIKAFLHGEQHYRRFNVDSARFYYDQAIASDSGFGLAYARKWKAMWWRETVAGALMALRAGALNHGLARRESLLIVIDSLWADYYVAVSAFASNTGGWSRFDRIFTTGDILLQEYPHDPEVWYEVGETWFHLGPFVGVTEQETYEAFRRAVTLDSGYVPAYEHLVELSLTLDGPAEAMRVVDAYLGRIDWPTYRERLRLVRELISGGGVTAEAQRMIDSAEPS
jgi:serine/threonine-protein kinase